MFYTHVLERPGVPPVRSPVDGDLGSASMSTVSLAAFGSTRRAVLYHRLKNPRARMKSNMCLRFLPCTVLAVAADQSSRRALLPRSR
jgi:hypothetical protein